MLRVFGMDLGKKINGIRDIVGGTMGVLRGRYGGTMRCLEQISRDMETQNDNFWNRINGIRHI